MHHQLPEDLLLAQRAALAGAQIGLAYFARVTTLTAEQKADGSIVTEADRVVEASMKEILAGAHPTDAFLGEETGASGCGARRWVLDGIDGTSVFVKGDDRWQSLIALEVDGEVTTAVCIIPAQGTIWYAARDHGAYVARWTGGTVMHPRRLGVGDAKGQAGHLRIGVLPPYDALPTPARFQAARALAGSDETPWNAHAALLVAAGDMDIAVQFGGFVWDYAALSLIVEEAGGVAEDEHGRPYPITGTAVFARTRELMGLARARLADPAGL